MEVTCIYAYLVIPLSNGAKNKLLNLGWKLSESNNRHLSKRVGQLNLTCYLTTGEIN